MQTHNPFLLEITFNYRGNENEEIAKRMNFQSPPISPPFPFLICLPGPDHIAMLMHPPFPLDPIPSRGIRDLSSSSNNEG